MVQGGFVNFSRTHRQFNFKTWSSYLDLPNFTSSKRTKSLVSSNFHVNHFKRLEVLENIMGSCPRPGASAWASQWRSLGLCDLAAKVFAKEAGVVVTYQRPHVVSCKCGDKGLLDLVCLPKAPQSLREVMLYQIFFKITYYHIYIVIHCSCPFNHPSCK